MKSKRWLGGLLSLITVMGIVSAPGVAEATSAKNDDKIVVSFANGPAKPADNPEQTSPTASCNVFNRTYECLSLPLTVTVLRNGKPTGELFGTIKQTLTLNVKKRTFSERISLYTRLIEGNATGIIINLSAACGGRCSTHVSMGRGPLRARHIIRGKISYRDNVAKNVKHYTSTRYSILFVKAGYTPDVARWNSEPYRCDDTLKGQGAGCVFYKFTPHISLAGLHFISQNIRNLQSHGAPRLLHRNSHLTTDHRRQVCGKAKLPPTWKPPAGWPLPLSDPLNKPSCDEYAFAATVEGGTKPHNGYDWVPLRENNSQGNKLKNFYYANRVLDATSAGNSGDGFNVTA